MQVANGTQSEVAAIYNMTSNTYVPFHIAEAPQASGHILLPDGRGLIVGGETSAPAPSNAFRHIHHHMYASAGSSNFDGV